MLSEGRRSLALSTRGFMPAAEGDALWEAATAATADMPGMPMLELGSYCGRSTVWLGDVAEGAGTLLFALDHHRGSEENQAGWDHHDLEVVDDRIGKMDTLPFFRATIHDAGLEDSVVGLVGPAPAIGAARLPTLDAARCSWRHAGNSRRVPGSGRWWPAAVRADLPACARVRSLYRTLGDWIATHPDAHQITVISARPPQRYAPACHTVV
jgi:hypothetical protein